MSEMQNAQQTAISCGIAGACWVYEKLGRQHAFSGDRGMDYVLTAPVEQYGKGTFNALDMSVWNK